MYGSPARINVYTWYEFTNAYVSQQNDKCLSLALVILLRRSSNLSYRTASNPPRLRGQPFRYCASLRFQAAGYCYANARPSAPSRSQAFRLDGELFPPSAFSGARRDKVRPRSLAAEKPEGAKTAARPSVRTTFFSALLRKACALRRQPERQERPCLASGLLVQEISVRRQPLSPALQESCHAGGQILQATMLVLCFRRVFGEVLNEKCLLFIFQQLFLCQNLFLEQGLHLRGGRQASDLAEQGVTGVHLGRHAL